MISWEEKISQNYRESLWKEDLREAEKVFHLILREWSGDVLRPFRRVIGSCKKHSTDDVFEMASDSLSLYLQKIKLCCEDFNVYKELKRVEDLRLDKYEVNWKKNLIPWRKEIENGLLNFTRFAKEAPLLFSHRAGSMIAGLNVCTEAFLTENLKLSIKEIVSYTDKDQRKNKIILGLKVLKVVGEYFRICRESEIEILALDDYSKQFQYLLMVVRKLKLIFVAIDYDTSGEFDYLRERLSESVLKFSIFDPDMESVFESLVSQFEPPTEEYINEDRITEAESCQEESKQHSNILDSTNDTNNYTMPHDMNTEI